VTAGRAVGTTATRAAARTRAEAPAATPLPPPKPPRHARAAHRVPDLQLYLLAVNVDHARAKLYADGQVVHGLEALVRELQQQA
jgi:hypothetical protein